MSGAREQEAALNIKIVVVELAGETAPNTVWVSDADRIAIFHPEIADYLLFQFQRKCRHGCSTSITERADVDVSIKITVGSKKGIEEVPVRVLSHLLCYWDRSGFSWQLSTNSPVATAL